jgi:HSP20 family protein
MNSNATSPQALTPQPPAPSAGSSNWTPEEIPQLTVDVYRRENSIFVVSTVAGVSSGDVDISIDGNILLIKGVRRKPYDENQNMVLLEECFWGEFVRKLTINEKLDIDNVAASLNQGILTIELPILKISQQRKIQVQGI